MFTSIGWFLEIIADCLMYLEILSLLTRNPFWEPKVTDNYRRSSTQSVQQCISAYHVRMPPSRIHLPSLFVSLKVFVFLETCCHLHEKRKKKSPERFPTFRNQIYVSVLTTLSLLMYIKLEWLSFSSVIFFKCECVDALECLARMLF